jgi:tRNA(Arg) A34 adenosine deaminase TadA
VDVNQLALDYSATLPMWVLEELVDLPETFETDEDKMRLVNVLARRNYREGTGGPFAAIVVESETGALVSAGVNLVLKSGLSSSHAEVVAISLAQTRVGTWDLGADADTPRELIVNWRPCVQCYGAVMWSGVKRLVVAGDGPELEHLTKFDEGPMVEDWAQQFENRGIEVVQDVLRDEAIDVYREYGDVVASGEVIVYNARGTGPIGD